MPDGSAFAPVIAAALVAAAVIVASGPVRAQGQSQGNSGKAVQIEALGPIDLGRWDGHGPLTAVEDHCVNVRKRNGFFTLRAFGEGSGGAFELYDGAATLSYDVQYDDGSGRVGLNPGKSSGSFKGIKKKKDFEACVSGGRGENRLLIQVPAADLRNALAGDYSGTLRLMIEAN